MSHITSLASSKYKQTLFAPFESHAWVLMLARSSKIYTPTSTSTYIIYTFKRVLNGDPQAVYAIGDPDFGRCYTSMLYMLQPVPNQNQLAGPNGAVELLHGHVVQTSMASHRHHTGAPHGTVCARSRTAKSKESMECLGECGPDATSDWHIYIHCGG